MLTGYTNNLGLDPTLGLNAPTPFSRLMGMGAQQGSTSVAPTFNPYSVFGPGPTTVPLNPTGAPMASATSGGSSASSGMAQILQMMIMMKQLDSIGQSDDSSGSDSSSSGMAEMAKMQMMGQMFSSGGNNMFSNLAMMKMMDNFDFSSSSASSPRKGSFTSAQGVKARNLSPEFKAKVDRIAKEINCDPMDLMAIMNSESGFDHKVVNDTVVTRPDGSKLKPTYATGLIQFMPDTAEGLGTTTDALKRMTPERQLDYVKKYFVMQKKAAGMSKGQALSGADLYALTYLPARANREVLSRRGEAYYDQNTGLDVNKDGKVTKTDLAKLVQGKRDKLQKSS